MSFPDGIRGRPDGAGGQPSPSGGEPLPARAGIFEEIVRATGCDDWRPDRSPMRRRNCEIHFIRSPTFRLPELVVKIYLPGVVKPNLAKDMDAKSRVCHAAATATCSVPEPVFVSPGQNAWAMERIHVPTSGKRLKIGFPAAATRDGINRSSAKWLHWFHARSTVAAAPFDAAYFLGKLATLRRKIGEKNGVLLADDRFLQDGIALAEKVAGSLHGVGIPHASVHGDFTPFNLFERGGTTIGFDFLAKRRLPVSFDICRFLLYLDLYRLVPAAASELRKYGCRKRDFEIFMDAYGGRHGWAEDGRWVRFQYLEVVRRITSLALRRSEGRKFPFGVIETAYMRRTARHLMEELR